MIPSIGKALINPYYIVTFIAYLLFICPIPEDNHLILSVQLIETQLFEKVSFRSILTPFKYLFFFRYFAITNADCKITILYFPFVNLLLDEFKNTIQMFVFQRHLVSKWNLSGIFFSQSESPKMQKLRPSSVSFFVSCLT